jgi:DNA-binding IscR family transcriptional regulator
LAKPPELTPIASIIAALEGPIALTECGLDHNHCDQLRSCHVRGNWSVLNRAIQTALEAVTLADMAQPMTRAPEEFRLPLAKLSLNSRRIQE